VIRSPAWPILWEQEVAGSNPAIPTIAAGQMPAMAPLDRFEDRLTVNVNATD